MYVSIKLDNFPFIKNYEFFTSHGNPVCSRGGLGECRISPDCVGAFNRYDDAFI